MTYIGHNLPQNANDSRRLEDHSLGWRVLAMSRPSQGVTAGVKPKNIYTQLDQNAYPKDSQTNSYLHSLRNECHGEYVTEARA